MQRNCEFIFWRRHAPAAAPDIWLTWSLFDWHDNGLFVLFSGEWASKVWSGAIKLSYLEITVVEKACIHTETGMFQMLFGDKVLRGEYIVSMKQSICYVVSIISIIRTKCNQNLIRLPHCSLRGSMPRVSRSESSARFLVTTVRMGTVTARWSHWKLVCRCRRVWQDGCWDQKGIQGVFSCNRRVTESSCS